MWGSWRDRGWKVERRQREQRISSKQQDYSSRGNDQARSLGLRVKKQTVFCMHCT